jgi:predicted lipid-binding transport protein (Tim44 family)
MDYDIIIYAVIAAVLLGRLWFVFGRRNDEDRQRPNPFIAPLVQPQDNADKSGPTGLPSRPPIVPQLFKAAPASLAGGLEQIKARDAAFDEKQFLQEAKLTFTKVVEDFAKGDMTNITPLLSPPVLAHFQTALEARRNAGQVMESKINAIKDVETTAARIDGDQAFISVRFVSNQENVLRDNNNQVIGGEDGKVEEITDLWTFARDMATKDAPWLLVQTGA